MMNLDASLAPPLRADLIERKAEAHRASDHRATIGRGEIVETLNASEANASRIRAAAWAVAIFIARSWVRGGYWYVHFYGPDKALILKGPWTWAHSLVMEVKEHVFFIPLLLALYLPIAARAKLSASGAARTMVLSVAARIVLSGLAVEGAGAVVSYAVKAALVPGA
jgi:hypothetical protein